jgi:hypothetical protein
VALKTRVMASLGQPAAKGPVAPLIYRAEAYDDGDRFRETVWACDHDHKSVEGALLCGQDWLATQTSGLVLPIHGEVSAEG